jgi:hypothetical protein
MKHKQELDILQLVCEESRIAGVNLMTFPASLLENIHHSLGGGGGAGDRRGTKMFLLLLTFAAASAVSWDVLSVCIIIE